VETGVAGRSDRIVRPYRASALASRKRILKGGTVKLRLPPLILVLVFFLVAGCGDDKKATEPDGSPYLARTSIENVMANLRTAYEEQNLGEYESLFDQDQFIFVFSPADVGGQAPLPPSWGWAEERASAGNMFADTLVKKIELAFTFETPRPVEEGDDPPVDATHTTHLTSLDLIVTMENPDTGEQDIYVIQGDRHDFFFVQDPGETQDGQPVWKIVEWRDRSLGHAFGFTTTVTTWGQVKALYR
jgi:hypothetical protein